jgi:prevent-host-death family protein
VTISDYNGLMQAEVGIAELKGKLSEYLRAVRKGGEIVIKDRETPIARLVPYAASRPRLETIPATRPLKEMDELPFFRPKGLKPGDLEEALREERRDRFDQLFKNLSK